MTEIEALINVIADTYQVPPWLARGIAWGESSHNPNAIATEPDGRQSVGLFQIHDVHSISMEQRLDPEFNTRWAMENSVGPAYRQTIASGITDHPQILAYVWRYGQRCAEWAIAPAVERAMQYLERSDQEMPTPHEWNVHRQRLLRRLLRVYNAFPLTDEEKADPQREAEEKAAFRDLAEKEIDWRRPWFTS